MESLDEVPLGYAPFVGRRGSCAARRGGEGEIWIVMQQQTGAQARERESRPSAPVRLGGLWR